MPVVIYLIYLDAQTSWPFIWLDLFSKDDGRTSDLQLLRKFRQDLAASLRHHHHIFDANATEPRIIKSRFNRETLSIFQGHFLQPRIFVDLEPKPVTGSMEKSHVHAVAHFRRITALLEQALNRF